MNMYSLELSNYLNNCDLVTKLYKFRSIRCYQIKFELNKKITNLINLIRRKKTVIFVHLRYTPLMME